MLRRVMIPRWTLGVLIFFVMAVLIPSATTNAFSTGAKWQNGRIVYYTLDPNLDARLGVTGSTAAIDAAAGVWNNASPFRLSRAGTYDPNGNTISTADFRNGNPCAPGSPPFNVTAATACVFATPTSISRTQIFYNTSGSYSWNTANIVDATRRDVQASTTHEFGHWHSLNDNPPGHPEAIMTTSGNRTLAEDDKQGATQIYGIFTGFETNNAQGVFNRVTYRSNVNGYFNNSSPPPELSPRSAELSVPMISGSKYEMFSGYATSAGSSWIYMTMFHDEGDPNAASGNYLTIKPGMKLRWDQYNYQQTTISVDFAMTDETRLSNSGLKDQNGVDVHPRNRGGYATATWHYFEVDLSPLAGKKIRRWMIGYDNAVSRTTGQFRAYFENIRILYP